MEIMKPIMNGLAILMVIAGATVGFMENMVLGGLLIILAMLFMLAANMASVLTKLNELRQPVIPTPPMPPNMETPMNTRSLFKKPGKKQVIEPQIVPITGVPQQPAEIPIEPTPMPINIEKPEKVGKVLPIQEEALEARKQAEEAIVKGEEKLAEESESVVFKCKRCAVKGIDKQFPDEKRLKRHIGMAHYQDLEI